MTSASMHQDLKFDCNKYSMPCNRCRCLVNESERPANQTTFKTVALHQGIEPYKTICVHKPQINEPLIPHVVQYIIIACLLLVSGLFSGLNLGLMSLDTTELKIILSCGSETEKHYARMIYPARETGNYLLCSILFGNVIVNSGISILLGDLTSGLTALVISSLGIVSLGEILPQSICSRYGLAVGAKTLWITKLFMVITAPLSWPTSKALDVLFGVEVGHSYNRERLLELIRVCKETEQDVRCSQEVAIVSGALEMSTKTIADVMTNIDDVFMVPLDAILDTKMIRTIVQSGYTRIPVYTGDQNNVVALLNVKDLALIDADDKMPLETVCKFYSHKLRFVLDDTPLSVMLAEFKEGQYHMAFVQRIVNREDADPFYQLVGVVTLEDIIEEILQSEILDETDTVTDNRTKNVRKTGIEIKVKTSLFMKAYRASLRKTDGRKAKTAISNCFSNEFLAQQARKFSSNLPHIEISSSSDEYSDDDETISFRNRLRPHFAISSTPGRLQLVNGRLTTCGGAGSCPSLNDSGNASNSLESNETTDESIADRAPNSPAASNKGTAARVLQFLTVPGERELQQQLSSRNRCLSTPNTVINNINMFYI